MIPGHIYVLIPSLPLECELDLCNSLLMKNYGRSDGMVLPGLVYRKTLASILLAIPGYYLTGLLWQKPVLCCELLCGQVHRERN